MNAGENELQKISLVHVINAVHLAMNIQIVRLKAVIYYSYNVTTASLSWRIVVPMNAKASHIYQKRNKKNFVKN